MTAWYSLFWVAILAALAYVGVEYAGLHAVFGIVVPYIAIAVFLLGIIYRVMSWAKSPVPFNIPTTAGQQKSLPWIKNNNLESPHNTFGVIGRMLLEILLFRSLFRNTKATLKDGPKLVYGPNLWLWLAGIVFHYSFLVIFLRHFKYFAEPIPYFVTALQRLDGFFEIGLPIVYLTDIAILAALGYLFLRRVIDPKLRHLSMASDYFPLFLIMGIAVTGIFMRYFTKTDIIGVKQLGMGLLSFHPVAPEGIGAIFYMHLTLVSTLIFYFPLSKLMHMGGVFLSPTRNLRNDSRARRHINPWPHEVHLHTYEEYEDEFRPVMKAAGLPLDKEE